MFWCTLGFKGRQIEYSRLLNQNSTQGMLLKKYTVFPNNYRDYIVYSSLQMKTLQKCCRIISKQDSNHSEVRTKKKQNTPRVCLKKWHRWIVSAFITSAKSAGNTENNGRVTG